MPRRSRSAIVLAVLCAPAVVLAAALSIPVGGTTIQIPLPEGFVRVDGVLARWDAATAAFISPQNRRLLVLGTAADRAALEAGSPPDAARTFNIQVARAVESQEFGERTFRDAKADIRAGIDQVQRQLTSVATSVAAQGNRRLAPEDIDAALNLADAAFVGYFRDTPTSLGVTMAMKVAGSGAAPERFVVAFVMTPVNGRLLNLYANARYATEADRTWAENAVSAWADATVAANPRVTGPAGKPFDWASVAPMAALGVGALVVVWLVSRATRQRRHAG